jgi:hypothetical protein
MQTPTPFPLPGGFELWLSVYAFVLPLVLYAVWLALGFWDLARREAPSGSTLAWGTGMVLVPFLGAFAYHAVGPSAVPKPVKLVMLVGGPLLYVVAALVTRT